MKLGNTFPTEPEAFKGGGDVKIQKIVFYFWVDHDYADLPRGAA